MQDGRTRKQVRPKPAAPAPAFLDDHRVVLVILAGPGSGTELALDRHRIEMGRSEAVQLSFADDAMSREHACFEVIDGGFRVRDLASTNGVELNGSPVLAAELKHGDRLRIGDHEFQYLVERIERPVAIHDLPEG
jgi:pSer/pThr/pTyr-binding forkhead associated (FHA) protein